MTMMTVEDKQGPAAPPPLRSRPDPLDPWAEWKPQWSGRKKPPATPHDYQERHAPTKAVSVRLTATRTMREGRRRVVDARLWAAMSAMQQEAAQRIAFSYELMGRGVGFASSNWEKIASGGAPGDGTEAQAHLINIYTEWARRCAREKISHSMIIDILAFGKSLAQSDKERRVRKGTARANLLAGLDLYCKMRGWRP